MTKPLFTTLAALLISLSLAPAAVTSFTLVNADTNADIQIINDGDVINLDVLGTSNLNIRANVDVAPTNVVMALTGATTHNQTEGVAPYALWGDTSGNYAAASLNLGQHTLSGTPAGGAAYTVNFSVVNQTNGQPSANAGADKAITLPINHVTLNGSGSDDGSITSYLWTQQSGPNAATLSGQNTANLNASNLIAGTYVMRLTVTDNDSNTAYDEALIVVSSGAPPVPEGSFIENNGLVVMEVESMPTIGGWESRTAIAGYKGSAYYYNNGADSFGTPGKDVLSYEFTVTNAGNYQAQVRSRIAVGTNNTEHNDVWVRLVDASGNPVTPIANDNHATGSWYKAYMNRANTWSYETSNKDNDPHSLSWSLSAGSTYKFQFSRRSNGHAVDRIVLWERGTHSFASTTTGKSANDSAMNALPESERASSTGTGKKIAYIHGDVAADGTIPSGGAAAYDQMLLDDSGSTGCSEFKAMVEGEGYAISQHYDASTTLNAAFLDEYDVIIFGLHQKVWSSTEKAALDAWLRAGGGALFYSDSAAGGLYSSVGAQNPVGQTAVNNVISTYGMEVLVDQANGVKAYRAGPNASHPIVAGRPVFEGEGVSPVAVDPTSDATVLIPYLNDANYKVSGDPTISHTQNLTISNPDYAALAMTQVQDGKLMVMFDRQPMWNDGPGSDIDKRDNREILRRIVSYLAGDLAEGTGQDGDGTVTVEGELKQWHRVDLKQLAVHSSELATPNPFRDYRMNVTFTAPSGAQYLVPGYFATDANGGDEGNVWMAHLNPHETGEWSYAVSFRSGADVAVSLDANAGAAVVPFDGKSGTFNVVASDKSGKDFRAADKGMLINRGNHYLTYGGNGKPFLYTGPGIPENILGYRGFTNTTVGIGHEFTAHGTHWNAGDPDWGNQDGRNLIGALNYIADQGANCLYMMSNTIGGDALDVFPHPTPDSTKDRYDLLKLQQWDVALRHAQAKGIFLHWHLAEHESGNSKYYGGTGSNPNITNTMTVERKLSFRMLNAVFGHYNGLKWNIMEETEFAVGDRTAQMTYIKAVDPYDHPVTYQVGGAGIPYDTYNNHLGETNGIDAGSFQGSASRATMFNTINAWRASSANAGVKWTCAWDEPQRIDNDNNDETNGYPMGRRDKMWPCLMGGGDGFMWYIQKDGGGHGFDQRIEDFTIMQNAFNWSGYARDFLGDLPLLEMESSLTLVNSATGTDYTLAKANQVYAIFNDRAGTGMTLDLSAAVGDYSVRWFDPRAGGALQNGSVIQVSGGAVVSLGDAPSDTNKDWAVLVERVNGNAGDYTNWTENYSSADLSNPNGDHDGDGISNNAERIFGTDPTSGSSGNPIAVPLDRVAGTFSYTRRDDALTGLIYTIWTSTDLNTWTQDTGALQSPGIPDGQGTELVQVTVSAALLASASLFLQVRAD